MTLRELLEVQRDEILRLADKHGALNVRVFGSVARGEADSNSDVDFLVEMEPHRSLLDQVGLIQDLEDLLAGRWMLQPKRGCGSASRPVF
jgi:uncharacterized protein